MAQRAEIIGWFYAAEAVLGWGFAGFAIKNLSNHSWREILAGRFLWAALAMGVIFLATRKDSLISCLSQKKTRLPFLFSLFYYYFSVSAFSFGSVVSVYAAIAVGPLCCYLICADFSLTRLEILGFGSVLIGLFILGTINDHGSSSFSYYGFLLGLSAAGCSVGVSFFSRENHLCTNAPDPIGLAFITFAFGSIFSLIWSPQASWSSASWSLREVWFLVFLGTVSTALPTFAYLQSSKILSPKRNVLVLTLIPLIASIVNFITSDIASLAALFTGAIATVFGFVVLTLRDWSH